MKITIEVEEHVPWTSRTAKAIASLDEPWDDRDIQRTVQKLREECEALVAGDMHRQRIHETGNPEG